ncbi:MAG: putative quinol monooxygenase [Pseudomonadota bacterium]
MTQQVQHQSATTFVVIAEFMVKEGMLESFLAHAFDDSQNSLAQEPGCLQFDVLRTPDHANGVLFYEVYQSRQAFDEHLKTAHVDRFRAILAEHVQAERPVRTLERLSRMPA